MSVPSGPLVRVERFSTLADGRGLPHGTGISFPMSTGPNLGKDRCRPPKSRPRSLRVGLILKPQVEGVSGSAVASGRGPAPSASGGHPRRARGGRGRWRRRRDARPARGPPRPTSARGASPSPKTSRGPSRRSSAAPRPNSSSSARAQQRPAGAAAATASARERVRGRARASRRGERWSSAALGRSRSARARRASTSPPPVDRDAALAVAGSSAATGSLLDHLDRSPCGKSGLTSRSATEGKRRDGVAQRLLATCSVVISRAALSSAARTASPLGVVDPGDLHLADGDERRVAQPHPAADAKQRRRHERRGRAGRRRCPAGRCEPAGRRRGGRLRGVRPPSQPAASAPAHLQATRRLAERVDVAGAEREHQVARAQLGAQERLGVGDARHPGDRLPPPASAAASATSRPVTPGKSSARSRAG